MEPCRVSDGDGSGDRDRERRVRVHDKVAQCVVVVAVVAAAVAAFVSAPNTLLQVETVASKFVGVGRRPVNAGDARRDDCALATSLSKVLGRRSARQIARFSSIFISSSWRSELRERRPSSTFLSSRFSTTEDGRLRIALGSSSSEGRAGASSSVVGAFGGWVTPPIVVSASARRGRRCSLL